MHGILVSGSGKLDRLNGLIHILGGRFKIHLSRTTLTLEIGDMSLDLITSQIRSM